MQKLTEHIDNKKQYVEINRKIVKNRKQYVEINRKQ